MWVKIINLFTPIDYSDQPYGWLKNQFGHINITRKVLFLIVLLSFILDNRAYLSLAIPIPIFWFSWEFRHYILYNDHVDCLEDLLFENLSFISFCTFIFTGSILYLMGALMLETFIFLTYFFIKYRWYFIERKSK